LLAESAEDLTGAGRCPLQLVGVAVRDAAKDRPGIDPALVTADAMSVATSGADIVVEVMGGIEPARTLILAAMQAGSSVVTANRALLAADGAALLRGGSARGGVDLYFEASVAGAIPLLRPLRESLSRGPGHRR
jgi:homoserine dehydrogenase